MKIRTLFILLLLLSVTLLHAQTIDNTDSLDMEISRIWGLTDLNQKIEMDGRFYISNINATADSNNEYITIKWNGVINPDLVYYVYRSTVPIETMDILNNNSTLITYINAEDNISDMFSIEDYPTTGGPHYYAVTSSIFTTDTIFNAEPNMDITIEPIYLNGIFDIVDTEENNIVDVIDNNIVDVVETETTLPLVTLNTQNYVNGLKSRIYSRNRVILSWDRLNLESPSTIEYMLYRYSSPISDEEQLKNANLILRTTNTFANDIAPLNNDAYYYVSANILDDDIFVAEENYTVNPIIVDSNIYRETTETIFDINEPFYFKINYIDAFIEDGEAIIKWEIPNIQSSNYHYMLFTSTNQFYSGQNVILDNTLLTAKKIFTNDIEIEDGKYVTYTDYTAKNFIDSPIYYSLFVVLNNQMPNVVLSDGMYTIEPILFTNNITTSSESIDNVAILPENITQNDDIDIILTRDKTDKAKTAYNKALVYFNQNKYQDIRSTLESISVSISDKQLYYDINLLLSISYYKLGQKKKSLDTLKKIRSISPTEVDFWIGQVLSDL